MVARIKRWLAPPDFPGDEEKSRLARLMNTLGLYFALFLVLALAVYVPFFADDKPLAAGAAAGLLGLYFVARRLLFRGRVELAGALIVVSTWLIFQALAVFSEGLNSPATAAAVVSVIGVALLLRARTGYVIVAFSILIGLATAWLRSQQLVVPVLFTFSPLAAWLYYTLSLTFAFGAVRIVTRDLQAALAQARQQRAALLQAEQALRQGEQRFQMFMEYFPGLAYIKDAAGHTLFANQGFQTYLGLDPLALIGQTNEQIFGAQAGAQFSRDDQQVLDAGAGQTVEETFGGRSWSTHKFAIRQPGSPPLLGGVTLDVSARQQAERAARLISEVQLALLQPCERVEIFALVTARLHELVGDCIIGTGMLDDTAQTVTGVAHAGLDIPLERVAQVFGQNLMYQPIPLASMSENELRIYRSGRLERLEDGLHTLLASFVPRPVCQAVEKLLRVRDVYATGFIYGQEHLGALVLLARTDITPYRPAIEQVVNLAAFAIARKRAEEAQAESERRFRETLENVSLVAVGLDPAGQVTFCNDFLLALTGWQRAEVLGQNWFDQFVPAAEQAAVRQIFAAGMQTGQLPGHYDNELRTRAGEARLISWSNTLLRDPRGQVIGTISLGADITDRRRAEERLRATLTEKDALLREVHHRVKNNLQAIISLINMRTHLVDDAATQQFLKELGGQARTMSLVYEQLYQADSLSRVDLALYLRQLTSNVLATFGRQTYVQLQLEAAVWLEVAHAMPCGLIVNELLTNSLKHAFPPGFAGQPAITITLRQIGTTCHLVYADNGVGLPPGLDWRASRSLGLQLVDLWATHQLGGTLAVTGGTGTTFAIAFDLEPRRPA